MRRITARHGYTDRRDAGRVLAGLMTAYRRRDDVLVLGLARGGVPVGWEVAAELCAPFDAFTVRKLGCPDWSELAMGAVASGGAMVFNRELMRDLQISDDQIDAAVHRELAELHRREAVYRNGRPAPDAAGRVVILVDDGVATGATMVAAVRALRAAGPGAVVAAVPVGSATTCRQLRAEADDVICAHMPDGFTAVGQAYDDFRQTTDDEVCRLLALAP